MMMVRCALLQRKSNDIPWIICIYGALHIAAFIFPQNIILLFTFTIAPCFLPVCIYPCFLQPNSIFVVSTLLHLAYFTQPQQIMYSIKWIYDDDHHQHLALVPLLLLPLVVHFISKSCRSSKKPKVKLLLYWALP